MGITWAFYALVLAQHGLKFSTRKKNKPAAVRNTRKPQTSLPQSWLTGLAIRDNFQSHLSPEAAQKRTAPHINTSSESYSRSGGAAGPQLP